MVPCTVLHLRSFCLILFQKTNYGFSDPQSAQVTSQLERGMWGNAARACSLLNREICVPQYSDKNCHRVLASNSTDYLPMYSSTVQQSAFLCFCGWKQVGTAWILHICNSVCCVSVTFQYLQKHLNLLYAYIRGHQRDKGTNEPNSFLHD